MRDSALDQLIPAPHGRLPPDDWRDVLSGVSGVAIIAAAFLTPFLRGQRAHWGMSAADAARSYPGDELVPEPLWSWSHAIEIDAPAKDVWPWVAQIGAGRGGFYSYQWLENVIGCGVHNAESIHPDWVLRVGDDLVLHPRMPPPKIVEVAPGHHFVAHIAPDPHARAIGEPWAAMSWLFLVEPIDDSRCRFASRYRAAASDDFASQVSFGPALLEPIGFAMDRRMLLGVKTRAEEHHRAG